ncbi:phosphotransferase family protein [Nocardia abscessus]|uniref:phosphotransferase family protein n=1 Tax=Nocardia abscessus TaxID=120957 RepID=UPI0002FADA2D|nr:phosphotransferase [Nocardia abscessus]MCC3329855.1 aminoglycoside phosphotransferase family protein [Nocardia abscessus]
MVNFLGTASRIGWAEVPRPVRVGIERMLGDVVCAAADQGGGFSHGVAVRVRTVGGDAAFVKAIEAGDGLAPVYRQEARIASRLPATAPAPRCRFSGEIAGWFVAGFDDVEGTFPRLDEPGELRDTLELVTRLATELTPSPPADVPTVTEAYGPELVGWRAFASEGPPADLDGWPARHLTELAELEATWMAAAAGNTLLHTDLRPDNMVRRADGAVLAVDWAWACRGAAWMDLVALAPSIAAAGVDPDPIIATHPVTRDVDPAAVDAFVCALAGYWAVACRKPGPPRSPHLRGHQAAFARITIGWLACRLGWQ